MSIGRTFKALTRSNDRRFVELLSKQAELTVRALLVLEKFGREANGNPELVEQLKEIERQGDAARRVLIDELLHTYATNETAVELAMYRIGPPEGMSEMTKVLTEGARHISAAVGELLDHPGVAAEHAVRAKRSENRIDSLYHQAVGQLFDSKAEMNQILKAREIYRHLKNSADRIDRAADEISVIVIKRS